MDQWAESVNGGGAAVCHIQDDFDGSLDAHAKARSFGKSNLQQTAWLPFGQVVKRRLSGAVDQGFEVFFREHFDQGGKRGGGKPHDVYIFL